MNCSRPRAVAILIFTILSTISSLPLQAATPVHHWSQRFGSTSGDRGYSVAVDLSGNVYVTGYFQGTVNFGGGNLVSSGSGDIFVAKYNAAGAHQWSQRFGDSSIDLGQDIAVDAAGNVYVTGRFRGSVDFGGGALVSVGGASDAFVAKYNTSGGYQWSKRFGAAGDSDEGLSIIVDASGNVLVTGYFELTVDFGGGDRVSAGSYDMFIAKYSAGGAHQWSQRYGDVDGDTGYSIAADASGNVFVIGYISGTVNLGGMNLVSAGSFDVFVAKYNASGVHQWSKSFGDTEADEGLEVAVDASGNVLVTGLFRGIVNLGGMNLVSAGSDDIFMAKYDASGVHEWSYRYGSTLSDQGFSVATDGLGNVFATGLFNGTVDFGGGALVSAGSEDIFFAKYNAGGAHEFSQAYGSAGSDGGHGVALDAVGNILLTGYFTGTTNFGGGGLVSAGSEDIIVARYSFLPTILDIKDIGNDQGRLVKIRFLRAYFDGAGSPSPIVRYEAYRRDAAPPSGSNSSGPATSGRTVHATGWTEVGAVAAHGETSYGIDVPTIGDSTITLGQYESTFFIRAATSNPVVFFDSDIDSGYSLDNLAPSVPENFTYSAGIASWDESPAGDFDYFTVYGSNTDAFGTATVVDYSVAPTMDVTASPYVFYYVTATDFSGNEGKPARVNTLSDVDGTPKSYVLSVSNYPNPFNPRTTVGYTVPARGPVTVAIYDARGALVTTLVSNVERAAGAYTIEWSGQANDGTSVSSGVYFARIEQSGSVRSKKMVLLK